MGASLGLNLESKEDSEEDSKDEETNWGLVFMLLKSRGFSESARAEELSVDDFIWLYKELN